MVVKPFLIKHCSNILCWILFNQLIILYIQLLSTRTILLDKLKTNKLLKNLKLLSFFFIFCVFNFLDSWIIS